MSKAEKKLTDVQPAAADQARISAPAADPAESSVQVPAEEAAGVKAAKRKKRKNRRNLWTKNGKGRSSGAASWVELFW